MVDMKMATGITKREKYGDDAITATCLQHPVSHPLPSSDDQVALHYPNRMEERYILSPVKTSFNRFNQEGRTTKIDFIKPNSFVLSDNLTALHNLILSKQKATLIYLDPPYGTGFEFHSKILKHAYKDNKSPATYLEFMRRRLVLLRELLTNDGSIYLHIGHQMLFHIKIIMDDIFGSKNFRNLIVRKTCSSKNSTRRSYPNLSDYILFYTKSPSYKWDQPREDPDPAWIEREYTKIDERGRYKLVPLHAPGIRHGETGMRWRGLLPPPGKHWQYVPSKLDELDRRGEIHWSRNGNPRRKIYLKQNTGVPLTSVWTKFRDAHHQSIKITGYPTEKNLDMLRIIVNSGTSPGDLVLDPFCGSGTTLHAANDLDRRWIGIDESFTAAHAVLTRLRYGLRAMGDYVDRAKKPNENSDAIMDDMFPLPHGKDKYLSVSGKKDFQFIVDSKLIDNYKKEIECLSLL